jgi:uncharacterized protein with NRDE domain
MCLIAIAWQVSRDFPLMVAANRDEFYARPSAAAALWKDHPTILAGRDLQAGGTWLGVSTTGRFAAITNIRDPDGAAAAPRSRGELTADFLRGNSAPADYLAEVRDRLCEYLGFNLLIGAGDELWYLHGVEGGTPRRLEAGVYGLSNAALDVPWPKVRIAREGLAALLRRDTPPGHDDLAACVSSERLAAPQELVGHGLVGEMAERLSAQFIVTDTYGTRCRSTVLRTASGELSFREERFAAGGATLDRRVFTLGAPARGDAPID